MKRRIFDESAKQRIMALVHGVLAILPFDAKNQLVFRYEHAGEGTFTDVNEAPVNRIPYTLIVNIDWYETADDYDVKLLLRHEARHLYQQNQILKLRNGQAIDEDRSMVLQWNDNYTPGKYIRNTPGNEIAHFQQACEVDAYVFATYLCTVETFKPDGSYNLSVVQYPGIADIIENNVRQMIDTTPYQDLVQYANFYSKQKA